MTTYSKVTAAASGLFKTKIVQNIIGVNEDKKVVDVHSLDISTKRKLVDTMIDKDFKDKCQP